MKLSAQTTLLVGNLNPQSIRDDGFVMLWGVSFLVEGKSPAAPLRGGKWGTVGG